MPPKKGKGKKGGKGKADAPGEPEHDSTWEKAVETGLWERPVTSLPDACTWPTWGALRERVLTACKEIRVQQSPTVRDAFVSEIVKLSPPELRLVDLQAAQNLHKVTLSPMTSCPKLEVFNMAMCPALDYVLLQSNSITSLDLHKCTKLTKALLHCPKLQQVKLTDCTQLETLMIWSDELKELDLTGCTNMVTQKLHCPKLGLCISPPLRPPPAAARLSHPPLAALLKESCKEVAQAAAAAKEQQWKTLNFDSTVIPASYRPMA